MQVYIMPEGSKNGDLRLYKAVEFPLRWEFDRILIDKPLVDASMFQYNGEYWLFGSDFHYFGSRRNGQLELWNAPLPLGPWKEHAQNPILNGHSSIGARSGGRPFVHEGKLYRIGQDCGETYGCRLRVFHVVTLTKEKFHEVEVQFTVGEVFKGRNAWNGFQSHHMDLHQLPSGEWMALMDGDRLPAGDLAMRYTRGAGALILLLSLNVIAGILLGFVSCVLPLSLMLPGKKTEVPLLPWVARPQFPTRLYRAASRLGRTSSSLRGRLRSRTYLWCLFAAASFLVSVFAICVAVNCFFGGSGAEEPYPVDGQYSQFTMIAMTYEARLWNLQMYIKHYSRCASVREIVVVWNKGPPPNPKTAFDSAVPVRVRVELHNSLNNRFKPDPLIKTKAVFELDDDIMMTCDDVERGFKAWRQNPTRIVGYYPRLVDGTPLKYRNERYARSKNAYNMVLTGAAFLDSELAFAQYWRDDVATNTARAVVDDSFNCEDILMNFIIANQSDLPRAVEYVNPVYAIDTSKLTSSAISRNTQAHYDKRSNCLLHFQDIFGGIPVHSWPFLTRPDAWDN